MNMTMFMIGFLRKVEKKYHKTINYHLREIIMQQLLKGKILRIY